MSHCKKISLLRKWELAETFQKGDLQRAGAERALHETKGLQDSEHAGEHPELSNNVSCVPL